MELKGTPAARANAKRLRREMTLPEVLLWQQLRRSEQRFRKQHAAGAYTLDFYCAPACGEYPLHHALKERGPPPPLRG